MSTYQQLLAQKAELEKKIEEMRKTETADAVQKVKAIIAEFSLTPADVFNPSSAKKKSTSSPVAPKYHNPTTNETWTGRGKPPKWIADKDREQFKIQEAA